MRVGLVDARKQRVNTFMNQYTAGGGRGRRGRGGAEVVGCFGKLKRLLTCYYCRGGGGAEDVIAGAIDDAGIGIGPAFGEDALKAYDLKQATAGPYY